MRPEVLPGGTADLANPGHALGHVIAMARSSFPMDWSTINNGSAMDLVCRVRVFDMDHDNHLMEQVPSGKRFFLSGLLEAGCDSYSIFDAILDAQFPVPRLSLCPKSSVLGHREVTWDSLFSVVDMCCGFGGMSQGILPGGFHSTVAVDQNEKMVKLFSTVHDVPTVVGDVIRRFSKQSGKTRRAPKQ